MESQASNISFDKNKVTYKRCLLRPYKDTAIMLDST